jgi:hypothetical protein
MAGNAPFLAISQSEFNHCGQNTVISRGTGILHALKKKERYHNLQLMPNATAAPGYRNPNSLTN